MVLWFAALSLITAQRSSLGLIASFLYCSKIGQNLVASSAVRFMFCATVCVRCARMSARSISTSWSERLCGCALASETSGAPCWDTCANIDTLHANSTPRTTTRALILLFCICCFPPTPKGQSAAKRNWQRMLILAASRVVYCLAKHHPFTNYHPETPAFSINLIACFQQPRFRHVKLLVSVPCK